MDFWVTADGDLERRDLLDAGHKIRRRGIAAGVSCILGADAGLRIAAQRHDVTDADFPIAAHNFIDLVAGGANAGEMGCRDQCRFFDQPLYGVVGAFARRAAGTVSDRHKLRR